MPVFPLTAPANCPPEVTAMSLAPPWSERALLSTSDAMSMIRSIDALSRSTMSMMRRFFPSADLHVSQAASFSSFAGIAGLRVSVSYFVRYERDDLPEVMVVTTNSSFPSLDNSSPRMVLPMPIVASGFSPAPSWIFPSRIPFRSKI